MYCNYFISRPLWFMQLVCYYAACDVKTLWIYLLGHFGDDVEMGKHRVSALKIKGSFHSMAFPKTTTAWHYIKPIQLGWVYCTVRGNLIVVCAHYVYVFAFYLKCSIHKTLSIILLLLLLIVIPKKKKKLRMQITKDTTLPAFLSKRCQ